MKAMIDRSGCIACGLCADTCPEVFHMADDGLAEAIEGDIPNDVEDKAVEARDNCPVSVISLE